MCDIFVFLRWLHQWYLPSQRRKEVCARNMYHERLHNVHFLRFFILTGWVLCSFQPCFCAGKRALEAAVAAPPTKKTKAEKKVVPPPKKVESSSEEESDSEEEVRITIDSFHRVMMLMNLF